MRPDAAPEASAEVLSRWGIKPLAYLGGRDRRHWLAVSGGGRLVLHAIPLRGPGDVGYELEVMRRVGAMGWPVPGVVAGPVLLDGWSWCLTTWLPGSPKTAGPEERRERGGLLADLHRSLDQISDLGQRGGFALADEIVADPAVDRALDAYEGMRPAEARLLRWHLEWARERFAEADLESVEKTIIHGDFAPWNLLFENGKLTGVLDFEATHLNYRAADFALSWRGYEDEVIEGYEEVHRLGDADRDLLAPAYVSWVFIGVKDEIEAMRAGSLSPHGFEWQVKHLARRSGLLSRVLPPYPGS